MGELAKQPDWLVALRMVVELLTASLALYISYRLVVLAKKQDSVAGKVDDVSRATNGLVDDVRRAAFAAGERAGRQAAMDERAASERPVLHLNE